MKINELVLRIDLYSHRQSMLMVTSIKWCHLCKKNAIAIGAKCFNYQNSNLPLELVLHVGISKFHNTAQWIGYLQAPEAIDLQMVSFD